jgi:peptide/nickel transport system permease protein
MKAVSARKGLSRLGLTLLLVFIIIAFFSKIIAPYDPWERFEPYLSPICSHILGTNDIGNDILSELIHGAKASLLVGFGTAFIATLIGLTIGLLSGYYKGIIDELFMGLTDIFLMIPRIPLVIIIAAFLRPSLFIIIFVLGCTWWTSTARVVRSKVLQIREMSFITSSRTLGFKDSYIIVSDIIPHLFHVIVPKFMLTVASAMISEASLSFLGLGDPAIKSWGMMINFAFKRGGFINEMWWWYTAPGVCITLCVLSIVIVSFSVESEKQEYE